MTKAAINHTDSQPTGLYLLFFTELWERFGFYTLQAIIILYMSKRLGMSDHDSNALYAAFSALLYLTPTAGGFIADRYLGFQKSIIIGGFLFILAYLLCAIPSKTYFFLGLSLLVCANGFFKPNVSSIVGELYKKNDARRSGGFTLFYMGINIGSLIPPLFTGALVAYYGWHSGFILAALGMIIGQGVFLQGRRALSNAGKFPTKNLVSNPPLFYSLLTLGILAIVGLCQLAFMYPDVTDTLVLFSGVIILAVVIYFISKEELSNRNKMFASLILIIISVGFWSIYNQAFTSLMLFADRNMDKSFLGISIDAETTQFFNPFFIILLSPLLNRFWIRLAHFGFNPSIQLKFSLGVLFMSAGFLVLALGAHYFNHQGMTSSNWLVLSYLLQTIGELLISPIGLAMITVLSPKHLIGMMMGVWFFSQAVSFVIGEKLANLAALPDNSIPNTLHALGIYIHAFNIYGLLAFAMALISFALMPVVKRLIDDKS